MIQFAKLLYMKNNS